MKLEYPKRCLDCSVFMEAPQSDGFRCNRVEEIETMNFTMKRNSEYKNGTILKDVPFADCFSTTCPGTGVAFHLRCVVHLD